MASDGITLLTGALRRISSIYHSVARAFAGSIMITIVVVMVAQVIARYVFNGSLIWAEELCRYLLIWMTFLLLGIGYETGEFVSLSVVPDMLTPRARDVLHLVMSLPLLWFLVLMVYYGWDYASRFEHQKIPALDFIFDSLFGRPAGVPVRYVYVSVSIGCGLLAIHVIVDDILRIMNFFRPNQAEPASDITGKTG